MFAVDYVMRILAHCVQFMSISEEHVCLCGKRCMHRTECSLCTLWDVYWGKIQMFNRSKHVPIAFPKAVQ